MKTKVNYINEDNLVVDIIIKSVDGNDCRWNFVENGVECKLDEGYEEGLTGYIVEENNKYYLYSSKESYYAGYKYFVEL